jgi:two-component system, cell cycle sensor histidine kinase and response regulator CckA
MKSDVVFALENAGWPALLVDGTGTIVRATQAAVKVFGSVLEGAAPRLSALWSPENGVAAEQFLTQWTRSPTTTALLKFRVKGGGVSALTISICAINRDSQRLYVLQLLPEAAPGVAPPAPPAPAASIAPVTPVAAAAPEAAREPTAESSLAQKQKLECALQLARTVSLDFNNALTSILGHTSLLLGQMEPNHPWRNSLLEVEKSAAKAGEIANDLGAFSRQEKEPRGQTAGNLNSILQRSVEVLQKSQNGKIEWTLQLERKLFAAKFDEAKMQQAFVKVLENAVQAVSDHGRIVIQSRNVELNEPAQDRDLRLGAGTYVCVEICDDGCGISIEVLPRIFEPFFTTKKEGNHRGLGLAWVYGIVTNHGGGVAVSSQPGAGTSVRVYLPAENKVARESNVDSTNLNGTQTILMVDDEDLLLTMGQTVLSAFGYKVLTANSGQKALEIFGQSKTAIDLVITDLVMPAMSGRELMERIQQQAPQTRILCTSGFVRPGNESDNSFYLQKPFTSQDLLVKVKQALTASG